jgi:hypothetical protein
MRARWASKLPRRVFRGERVARKRPLPGPDSCGACDWGRTPLSRVGTLKYRNAGPDAAVSRRPFLIV